MILNVKFSFKSTSKFTQESIVYKKKNYFINRIKIYKNNNFISSKLNHQETSSDYLSHHLNKLS